MNISRSQLNSFIKIYSDNSKETKGVSFKEKNKPKAGLADSLSLSPEAQEILKAAKLSIPEQDIRMDKVLKLRQKISSGTYNINGKMVAQKMIESFKDNLI